MGLFNPNKNSASQARSGFILKGHEARGGAAAAELLMCRADEPRHLQRLAKPRRLIVDTAQVI